MKLATFASRTYARPGVESACLKLQDMHGQCVPLLLWGFWTIDQALSIGPECLARAAAIARAWNEAAIRPLREVRRTLKHQARGLLVPDAAVLGERVKALELMAENLLLESLETISPAPGGGGTPILGALEAVVAAWGGPAQRELLIQLIQLAAAPPNSGDGQSIEAKRDFGAAEG